MTIPSEDFTDVTLAIGDTYVDDLREGDKGGGHVCWQGGRHGGGHGDWPNYPKTDKNAPKKLETVDE